MTDLILYSLSPGNKRGGLSKPEVEIDERWLRKQVAKGKTRAQIAKAGKTKMCQIDKFLKLYGIKIQRKKREYESL